MSLFKKSAQQTGVLALSFNGQGVRFAHVWRPAAGRPAVLRCESYRLQADNPAALEKLRKDARLDQYQCATLLDASEYQMLQVEAPAVPKPELKAAIRWRIKDLLNYPIDDAMVDVFDIPPSRDAPARSHAMYAVVSRNELIQGRVARFQEAKIPLAVIDIPEMAQRNIAALFERDGKGVALLSFDQGGGLLTFTHGGELYLSRRIDVTLSQLNDADEALRKQNFERVVLELQRSLDYFDRSYHFIALGRLLLGPLPDSIALAAYLAPNLSLPVEALNLSRALDFTATPELNETENQARYFQVLGAALRQEGKAL